MAAAQVRVLSGGQRLYNLSAGATLPSFAKERRKSKQAAAAPAMTIQLLQDLDFPGESISIRQSRDGEYLAISGSYPPMLRLYHLPQLSMKVERRLTAEIVKFQLLADDYTKVAFLLADRTIELHAQYGSHYRVRIPSFGRDVLYEDGAATLYVAASSSELYRLSLQHGTFFEPWKLEAPAANAIACSPVHSLLAVGTDGGGVEMFDPRAKLRVARLDVAQRCGQRNLNVTSVAYRPNDAVSMLVGTSTGDLLLYDIRSAVPLVMREHGNEQDVLRVGFHGSDKIWTADSLSCKFWMAADGTPYAAIEADEGTTISDVCIFREKERDTGLVLMSGAQQRVQCFYMPALGLAPSWCSYLDSTTEELEEAAAAPGKSGLYDDFQFLTQEEIDSLGLAHLIGTPYLRAAMHGFWMDARLYRQVRAVVDPFEYDRYKEERVRQKLEEQEATRIRVRTKLPKVNKQLAKDLVKEDEEGQGEEEEEEEAGGGAEENGEAGPKKKSKKSKKKGTPSAILSDPRFAALWTSKDFAVDKSDPAYRLYHPTAPQGGTTTALHQEYEEIDEDVDEDDDDDVNADEPASKSAASGRVSMVAARPGFGSVTAMSASGKSLAERLASAPPAATNNRLAPRPHEFSYTPGSLNRGRGGRGSASRGRGRGGASRNDSQQQQQQQQHKKRSVRGLPLKRLPARAMW